MNTYSFNNEYLTKDGEPWFPMMGEFHYSRYPKEYWKESLYKMKAGGIEVISSYVIWIHHEEEEEVFDFTGQRDLRTFVETVKHCGFSMFLRIGPWCHGEVRNGGFPDWLLKKEYEPRTNTAEYFAKVERYYGEIAKQVKGLLYEDGGPIIGIQVENEYGHCGGLQGEEGEAHMRKLTEIAKKVGLVVPYYTATGWGGAVTGGLLPVMGGYCEAPWDQRLTEIEPSGNYIFTAERNDHNIGSDHKIGYGITFDMTKFPFLTAELGGGLQVTHHRRPVARPKDIGAMSMVKLGSGVNLLGYYMYHGGTNPKGKLSTLQESRATGYLNDLPVYSYDFAAPIREFGQMSKTLREIKLLAMFIADFGSDLCKMKAFFPATNPLSPENWEDLRTSIRRDGEQGYLFVNNYQRGHQMKEHRKTTLEVELDNETITYPVMDIKNQDYFFLPFNMKVGDGILKKACATPLCKIQENGQERYVFYADIDPEYCWKKQPHNASVLTLSRNEALNAWKISRGKDYLLCTEGEVVETDDGFELLSRSSDKILAYPALPSIPEGYSLLGKDCRGFSIYECKGNHPEGHVTYKKLESTDDKMIYEVTISYPEQQNDCFLRVDFGGDQAKLYVDSEWVDDWFYTGETWEIGLKRFGFPKTVQIEILPLRWKEERYLEKWPEFYNGIACELNQIRVDIETVTRVL
ncbi:beta-galactosidase [Anaerosporobacter faecicola]|uniref:beta-galactosidase n=1 Tax=Anaerosporobacter faecicola TaxID=2718714 RepID=UPI00143C8941|nr:beta-galactosidase [Anaerosporobacter faecicola]